MWDDKGKDGGFNWWVFDLYDEGCTDELGLFYCIEEIERCKFLNQYGMPSLHEQRNRKLDEQLQRVKNELITFNSIHNITQKLKILEKDVAELKCKNVIEVNVCHLTVIASV